jgi:hypothetical protein
VENVAVVAVVVVAVLLVLAWRWTRRPPRVSQDADRFVAARTMTNRWAEDPSSAPKGVLDIGTGGAVPAQRDRDTADKPAD